MKYRTEQWLIGIVLTVAAAVLIWWLFAPDDLQLPVRKADEAAPPVSAPRPTGPQYPVRAPIEVTESAADQLRPLPPLSDSDQYFKIELTDLFGTALDEMLVNEALIEKFVTTVDNLPRSRIAERVRPMKSLPDGFAVDAGDADESYVLSPDNYARYEPLVAMLANVDTATLVNTYRRYYPLMQESYVNLGYPDGYFNDRVVEVIDHLLATPDVADTPKLTRPHVLYEYEDAALESLSSGQKLLIRMGKENAGTVQQALRAIREQLVVPMDPDPGTD